MGIEQRAYVVTGAGPVGWAVAETLAGQGHRVTVLTRSGGGPRVDGVTLVAGDANDGAALAAVVKDASAVFHCIHAPYRTKAWAEILPAAERAVMDAARAAGAVVVFPESLYAYSRPDEPLREDSPRDAAGGKRGIRAELLRARAAHPADTASVVAGDFFGPRVLGAHAGERMVPRILAGRPIRPLGSADQAHSFTYVPDLAAAMVTVAADPAHWNRVHHAPTPPPMTQRELAAAFADAAGVPLPRVTPLPGWLVRGLGALLPDVRELAETLYQFERPFVMDSAAAEARLGLAPTPLREAAAATVGWWRGRE